MASFGFRRVPGSAKRYVNVSNPDFAIGEVISRRRHAAYIQGLIDDAETGEGAEALAETQDFLDDLADSLRRREEAAEPLRQTRQGAGQRRREAFLRSWMEVKGQTRKEAVNDPEFKRLSQLAKGRPNPKRNPNVAARNKAERGEAFGAINVGGRDVFRETYEKLYGLRATGAQPIYRGRRDQKGNPIRRRRAA